MIRNATRKDIKEVAELLLEEFRKPPFNERDSLKAVLKSLNFYFRIGKVYAAINKKEIIGVVVFKIEQYWEGRIIIIEDLAVREKFKRQGIGKALINKVENYARKNKFKRILFRTHKKSSSIKFYQKCGYKTRKDIINFEKKII